MSRTVHIIENHDFGSPDAGQTHLIAQGFDVQIHKVWNGAPMPHVDGNTAGVMLLGGAQMVSEHEKWPYLADEFAFVERVIATQTPLLGICLGAQIIAHVLGATVRYGANDAMSMGYYETSATDAGKLVMLDRLMTLNGNAQGFDLPHGATLLATSSETVHPNQAFSYGDHVLALQFHPEVTRPILDRWQTEFADSIGRPGTRSLEQQNAGFERYDKTLKAWYLARLSALMQRAA